MAQHFVELSFQPLFFSDLEYWRSLRWPRKFLSRKSKKQLPVEFSKVNKLVLFVWVWFFVVLVFFPQEIWKLHARFLNFFCSSPLCATFLLSFSHEQFSCQPCLPTLLLFIHPLDIPAWILTRILSLEQPLLHLPWNSSSGDVFVHFHCSSVTAGEAEAALSSVCGGAQGRGLGEPVKPVGTQSTFIPVINECTAQMCTPGLSPMLWSKAAVLGHGTEDTPGKESVSFNLLEELLHFLPRFLLVCFPSDAVSWCDLQLIHSLLWNTLCELIRIPSNLKWDPQMRPPHQEPDAAFLTTTPLQPFLTPLCVSLIVLFLAKKEEKKSRGKLVLAILFVNYNCTL